MWQVWVRDAVMQHHKTKAVRVHIHPPTCTGYGYALFCKLVRAHNHAAILRQRLQQFISGIQQHRVSFLGITPNKSFNPDWPKSRPAG